MSEYTEIERRGRLSIWASSENKKPALVKLEVGDDEVVATFREVMDTGKVNGVNLVMSQWSWLEAVEEVLITMRTIDSEALKIRAIEDLPQESQTVDDEPLLAGIIDESTQESDSRNRWKFPKVEGIVTDEETGKWSEGAFHNDLMSDDDQFEPVWHQAEPEDWVTDIEAWELWRSYLEQPLAADNLHRLAVSSVNRRIRNLRNDGSI